MKYQTVFEMICASLILLFLYTALSKLSAFNNFRDMLFRSPVIGGYASILAWMLPAIELSVTIMLLIPRWKIAGLYVSLLLLSSFTLYLIYIVLFKSKNLPCSCGGVLSTMTWRQHIVFNLFFIVLCILGIPIVKSKRTNENKFSIQP